MPARVQGSSDEASSSSASPSPSRAISARSSLTVRERGDSRIASGSKRKRAATHSETPASQRRRTLEAEDHEDDELEPGDEEGEVLFDPDQPLQEKRRLQKGFRDLLCDITENQEDYLQTDSRMLRETIQKANEHMKQVKQTTEAAIDSRLLVSTTDLSYRKTLRLTQGTLPQGLDVDEFVSKCITYMRQGRGIMDDDAPELSSTQRQRRRSTRAGSDGDEDDDIGDEGDMMNWSHLGRFACLPYIRRPALPGFLLGPLSVEKKARKITKRSAPFRPDSLTETRPEVLRVEDLVNKKENDLTSICGKILQQLKRVQFKAQQTLDQMEKDGAEEEEMIKAMQQFGLRDTGGIDLMKFVVNPKSFGQTVENLFYVSFLIRDGRVGIDLDSDELPALSPVDREADDEEGSARHGASRHQAILSMDMKTWRDIIDVFDLKESMIEHRKETSNTGPGARGWYS